MNVGDVRNRNQPNVLNANSSAAQHLEGRMGSRLCKFATGLAIIGMPSANNHGKPAGAHADPDFKTILKYIGVGAAVGAPLGALLAHKLELDSFSGACVGVFVGSCVAAWTYALKRIGHDNRHEA